MEVLVCSFISSPWANISSFHKLHCIMKRIIIFKCYLNPVILQWCKNPMRLKKKKKKLSVESYPTWNKCSRFALCEEEKTDYNSSLSYCQFHPWWYIHLTEGWKRKMNECKITCNICILYSLSSAMCYFCIYSNDKFYQQFY